MSMAGAAMARDARDMMKNLDKQIRRLEAANAKKEALLLAKAQAEEDSDCEKEPASGRGRRVQVWTFKATMVSAYFHEELEENNTTASVYFAKDVLSKCFNGHGDFKYLFYCYDPVMDNLCGCISFKNAVTEALLIKCCSHMDYTPAGKTCAAIVKCLKAQYPLAIKHWSGVLKAEAPKWDFRDFFGFSEGSH